ncbi:hypothetical protein V8G54_024851 [Vigna mungo]|uniref:Uncharacterized protein n=1 Tax=Vigna mungo TaxID=3915 RepID=A0AAQ3N7V6_VIGMU
MKESDAPKDRGRLNRMVEDLRIEWWNTNSPNSRVTNEETIAPKGRGRLNRTTEGEGDGRKSRGERKRVLFLINVEKNRKEREKKMALGERKKCNHINAKLTPFMPI